MMKRFLFLLSIGIFLNFTSVECANANLIDDWKSNNAAKKELKATKNEIKNTFALQTLYSNNKDYKKLKEFYAESYRNSDAFDRNTTFKIIKENYELYPDLKMTTKINMININGDFATVDVFEYAEAKDIKREDIDLKGELSAFAHTIYYLQKIRGKWLITAEHAIEENNSVVFGEAKYLDLKFIAPQIVPAGEEYSSLLEVSTLPRKGILMGYITQAPAIFPLKEEDDIDALRFFEDTVLERIFTANEDNINEYNIASIGLTRGQPIPSGGIKFYLSGLAFLMTRVNVIPENTLYEKAQDSKEEHDDD